MEWLVAPIDPDRVHEVGAALSWHGRLMVLAWGGLAPLAILSARFFKVMPGQDWPRELDNQSWWRTHWIALSLVVCLSIVGLALVFRGTAAELGWHGIMGYIVIICAVLQVLLGLVRGSKGGPTAPAPDGTPRGHHYDMTPWRRAFERLHKSVGYTLLLLASLTILFGLWAANAPIWMWLCLLGWWGLLIIAFVLFQLRGMAIDTYQAIWGPSLEHPGNLLPEPGWGMHRRHDLNEGEQNVRGPRRHRV